MEYCHLVIAYQDTKFAHSYSGVSQHDRKLRIRSAFLHVVLLRMVHCRLPMRNRGRANRTLQTVGDYYAS